MPKLEGVKEEGHQPYYDTLIRTPANTAPTPLVANLTRLFSSNNIGDMSRTNMKSAGVLSSDQTLVVLALRAWLYFRGVGAADMYHGCSSQLFFTFEVGDKPFFQAPCWYFSSGGGVAGSDPSGPTLNLGTADHKGILLLGQQISIPPRQGFAVLSEFFPLAQGGAGAPSSDVRTNFINASSNIGDRVIMFLLDGIRTRDVL